MGRRRPAWQLACGSSNGARCVKVVIVELLLFFLKKNAVLCQMKAEILKLAIRSGHGKVIIMFPTWQIKCSNTENQ